jgi:hypothetical protein
MVLSSLPYLGGRRSRFPAIPRRGTASAGLLRGMRTRFEGAGRINL